ncbi:MAG: LamG domain-containing protein [Patescibacteria group bacterium]
MNKKIIISLGLIIILFGAAWFADPQFLEGSLKKMTNTKNKTEKIKRTNQIGTSTATAKLTPTATKNNGIGKAALPVSASSTGTQVITDDSQSTPNRLLAIEEELKKVSIKLDDALLAIKNIPAPVTQYIYHEIPVPSANPPPPLSEVNTPENLPAVQPAVTPETVQNTPAGQTIKPNAHWNFEEDQWEIAPDVSGNGNSARIFGEPAITAGGKIGKTITLDGDNDYLEIPLTDTFSFNENAYTFEAWINTQEKAQNQCLFSIGPSLISPENADTLSICIRENANLLMTMIGNADPFFLFTNNIGNITGSWHHLAVVYDSQKVLVYLDGTPVIAKPATGNMTVDPMNMMLRIGNSKTTGASMLSSYFKGTVDEVKVFNKALSPTEIIQEYNTAT